MMRLHLSSWVLIILWQLTAPVASALSCWKCDYARECNDPFAPDVNRTLVTQISIDDSEDDPSPCQYCYKMKTKEYGYHYVERGCISRSMRQYFTYELGCVENVANGIEETYCHCDEPDCNHSPVLKVTQTAAFMPLFYVALLLD